ncbi:MAG: MATE family efflux transporter [Gemmatimonadaceae bacterium]
MHDLTTGSVSRHLLKTTGFMLATMVFQTLYFLVDLYWVGRLGTTAVAGVAIAGNWTFVVLALTQMLGVGTTAVVSHAFGRRDHDAARMLFNQSQVLAMLTGGAFLAVGLAVAVPYSTAMAADSATARESARYLSWFVPAMALQFAMVAMGSALRASGNFRPTMVVSIATISLNMLVTPFLIFGWGTGRAFGVAGAAMGSFIAMVVAIAWLATYFPAHAVLRFEPRTWRPRLDTWRQMLAIGLPAGLEFAIMAASMVITYGVMRPFGAPAQAAFGIGLRVIQAGFMAVVALGFAVGPVAGQNYGARIAERVKATFRDAALMAGGYQLLFAAMVLAFAPRFVAIFSRNPETIAIGAQYLRITAFSFVPSGLVFVSSSMFQAMGNTMPALIASASRFVLFAGIVLGAARLPAFRLEWIWYIALGTVFVQLALSLSLLRQQFIRRLVFGSAMQLPGSEEPATAR